MSARAIKPYQPSNGTEGDIFMDRFCFRCHLEGGDDNPCMILGRSMAFNVDDPEYPKEWIVDDNGPTCTAFLSVDGEKIAPRCTATVDLFDIVEGQG